MRGKERGRCLSMFEGPRDASVPVGTLVCRQIGRQRVAEQLMREPIRMDGARLQDMRLDRSIDEHRGGTDAGSCGRRKEIDGEVALEERRMLEDLGRRATEL